MRLRGTIIAGFECTIDVSDGGEFSVFGREGGRTLGRGKTLDEAVETARKALTKGKLTVTVPFYTRSGTRGEATGRHAGTGNILARLNGVSGSQVRDDWTRADYFSGDTPQETIDEYLRLRDEQKVAGERIREIEQQHSFQLGKAVNRALDALMEEA